ncbi:hypothetical protein CHLRE_05g241643v5 [Chlamydomonas reinhardtii]|uniref:Uncharacterized protein n=1 Tax=Chlamydomonas reinhardtii TaxID=3055 RepID=A0A2K3DSJ2_CHLRE|nr:uncharacterized protein CHLRE_05g241643v5 [Chlamydomonas reinhardtii]PNW83502.1 hypothetical protein CHLRE_05g241643v5 [Chlamydomonas reinhardtii]
MGVLKPGSVRTPVQDVCGVVPPRREGEGGDVRRAGQRAVGTRGCAACEKAGESGEQGENGTAESRT